MSFPGQRIQYLDGQGRDLNALLADDLANRIRERAVASPGRSGMFLVNRRVSTAQWLHRTLQELANTGLSTTLVVVSQAGMADLESRDWEDYSLQFAHSPIALESLLVYQPPALACPPTALLGLPQSGEDGGSVGTVLVLGPLTAQEADLLTAARRLLHDRPWLAVWPGHPAELPGFALAAYANWTDTDGVAHAVSDAPVVFAHSVARDPQSDVDAAARLSQHLEFLAQQCSGSDRILVLCGSTEFRDSLSTFLGDAASTHEPDFVMGLSDFMRDGPFIHLTVRLPAFMGIRWRYVVQVGPLIKGQELALASQMLAGEPRRVDMIAVGMAPDPIVIGHLADAR